MPKLTKTIEIGKASGELILNLCKINILKTPTYPYYELYKVHDKITRESFFKLIVSEVFDEFRIYMDIVIEEIYKIEKFIDSLDNLNLIK